MFIWLVSFLFLMVVLRLSTHKKHEGKWERRQQRGDISSTIKRHTKTCCNISRFLSKEVTMCRICKLCPVRGCQEHYKPGNAHEKTARSETLCSIPKTKFHRRENSGYGTWERIWTSWWEYHLQQLLLAGNILNFKSAKCYSSFILVKLNYSNFCHND